MVLLGKQGTLLPIGTDNETMIHDTKLSNKAAISLQCKLNSKLIAALLFIPYSSLTCGFSHTFPIYDKFINKITYSRHFHSS